MVLLFSLLFFRCCNEQGDHEWFFFSDWQLDGPKEGDKLRYSVFLILLLCRNVGLGVSCGFFQDLSTGLKICSIQMLWTCSGKKTFGLQGKHSILFARLLLWLSSDKTLTSTSQMKRVLIGNDLYLHIRSKPRHLLLQIHGDTHAPKATKESHFDLFQLKRDAIKSNLSSARLPMSIHSVYPFKPCRVTVKGNSIVLLTYSSFNGKKFSLGNLPGEKSVTLLNLSFPW